MFYPPNKDEYFERVWELAREVPEGHAVSYGQIAKAIPAPPGVLPDDYKMIRARWVGRAMNGCPDDVPWWRVMNSQGKISLPAGSDAAEKQRRRLEMEGIVFDKRERVDFKQYGYEFE